MRSILFVLALLGTSSICLAQAHEGHEGHGNAAATAGYTPAERAAGLREGRGMGLALPAESNGYPGPRHVLELAEPLALTAAQRQQTQTLFDAMARDARRLGSQLLDQEAALDTMFRDRRASEQGLAAAVRAIADTETALKLTHLRTHLAMMELLSREQVARYVTLRRAGGGTGLTRPGAAAETPPEHRHQN
jgi:Spy/CpxP family protein refolding chaperone